MKEEQLRLEESEADMRKRLKSQREHHKEWEENRESRVGTWRDFAKGNKSKKVKHNVSAQHHCLFMLFKPSNGHLLKQNDGLTFKYQTKVCLTKPGIASSPYLPRHRYSCRART